MFNSRFQVQIRNSDSEKTEKQRAEEERQRAERMEREAAHRRAVAGVRSAQSLRPCKLHGEAAPPRQCKSHGDKRQYSGRKMVFGIRVGTRAGTRRTSQWTHCADSFDHPKNPISETILGGNKESHRKAQQ